jgi:hypothetical protein
VSEERQGKIFAKVMLSLMTGMMAVATLGLSKAFGVLCVIWFVEIMNEPIEPDEPSGPPDTP